MDVYRHVFCDCHDILLAEQLKSIRFIDNELETISDINIGMVSVQEPDERFSFLHEAAIIEFQGVLYASWYHCPKHELMGDTPICDKRSFDGGKSWSELEIM